MGALGWLLLVNFAVALTEEREFFGNGDNGLSSKENTTVYFQGKKRENCFIFN